MRDEAAFLDGRKRWLEERRREEQRVVEDSEAADARRRRMEIEEAAAELANEQRAVNITAKVNATTRDEAAAAERGRRSVGQRERNAYSKPPDIE